MTTYGRVQFLVGQLDCACRVFRQLCQFVVAQTLSKFRISPGLNNSLFQHHLSPFNQTSIRSISSQHSV